MVPAAQTSLPASLPVSACGNSPWAIGSEGALFSVVEKEQSKADLYCSWAYERPPAGLSCTPCQDLCGGRWENKCFDVSLFGDDDDSLIHDQQSQRLLGIILSFVSFQFQFTVTLKEGG